MQESSQSQLTVQDYPGNSSPVVQLNRSAMAQLSVAPNSFVNITGLRNLPTICLVQARDGDMGASSIRMGLAVRNYIKVTVGDQVKVVPAGNVPKGRRLCLLPMPGNSELDAFPGLILDTYLQPFFRSGKIAVRKNDYFTIGGGFGDIEFKVIDTSPGDTIRVTADTSIECQPDPDGAAARHDKESRSMFLYIHTRKERLGKR